MFLELLGVITAFQKKKDLKKKIKQNYFDMINTLYSNISFGILKCVLYYYLSDKKDK